MSSENQDSDSRVQDRVALDRAVQLKFSKFQDFLTEIAGNISPGGMFIQTDEPQPPGERFDFECSLADGFPLVCGSAEVVWTRERAEARELKPGMGVRFLSLLDNSAELIDKIIEHRQKVGEETFDLEREGQAATPAAASEVSALDRAAEPQGLDDEILAATERLVEIPTATDSEGGDPAPAAVEIAPTVPVEAPGDADGEPEVLEVEAVAAAPPKPPEISLPERSREEPLPAAVPQPVPSAPEEGTRFSESRVARARTSRWALPGRRLVELFLFALVIGAAAVMIFHQYWVRPRIERLETRLEDLTGNSRVGGPPGRRWATDSVAPDEAPAAGAARVAPEDEGSQSAVSGDAGDPAEEASRPADRSAEAAEAVRRWARAWSERRVDDYLAAYSAGFTPASQLSREEWEARRRDRLQNQGSIRVAVVSMEIDERSETELRATFTQSYRSDVFRDRVRKTLRLVREDEAWKIAEEIVVRQLPW